MVYQQTNAILTHNHQDIRTRITKRIAFTFKLYNHVRPAESISLLVSRVQQILRNNNLIQRKKSRFICERQIEGLSDNYIDRKDYLKK